MRPSQLRAAQYTQVGMVSCTCFPRARGDFLKVEACPAQSAADPIPRDRKETCRRHVLDVSAARRFRGVNELTLNDVIAEPPVSVRIASCVP